MPVHPISAGALGPGGSGPVGSMSMSMGGPSGSLGGVAVNMGMGVSVGMGVQVNAGTVLQLRAQLEHAQHEMGELQDEVRALRSELEARERLLLQLQDTVSTGRGAGAERKGRLTRSAGAGCGFGGGEGFGAEKRLRTDQEGSLQVGQVDL